MNPQTHLACAIMDEIARNAEGLREAAQELRRLAESNAGLARQIVDRYACQPAPDEDMLNELRAMLRGDAPC
jgi:hypothetical protein